MVYLVSLALIVAFAGYAPPKYGLQQNNYKNYMILCGFLIAVLSAFRSPYVGSGDSYAYVSMYKRLQTYESFKEYYDIYMADYDFLSSEAGFYYFMWILGHVFKDGQMALISSSILITWATCRFIRRNSVDAPLSLTIYVCLTMFMFNMQGMRQAMAMSICLFAYEFAKNRKLIPFVLTVLLAMLFHKTAMCFLPVYFLPKLKNTIGNWIFYIFGLMLCLLFVDEIIAGYYEISGEDYSHGAAMSGGGLFVVLLYLGAIVLAIYKYKMLERTSVRTALLGSLVGLVAYIARYTNNQILERISYYYYYFLILLIPEVIQELEGEEHKFIKVFFVIGAVLLFAYRTWDGSFRYFTFFFL